MQLCQSLACNTHEHIWGHYPVFHTDSHLLCCSLIMARQKSSIMCRLNASWTSSEVLLSVIKVESSSEMVMQLPYAHTSYEEPIIWWRLTYDIISRFGSMQLRKQCCVYVSHLTGLSNEKISVPSECWCIGRTPTMVHVPSYRYEFKCSQPLHLWQL